MERRSIACGRRSRRQKRNPATSPASTKMADRERLPDRRVSELVDFEHAGRRWTLTVGRFADGRVGEVFLDTPKASAIGEIAADAAIAASVAFQHGAPLSLQTAGRARWVRRWR